MATLLLRVLMIALTLLWGCQTVAEENPHELVLVVHPDSGVERLSRNDAINIFMGRYRQLPSGITALPVDLREERERFYGQLVNKTLAEINSYWARLVFSGRNTPPRQARDIAEVLEIVASNKGAIGYVARRDLNDQVKAVVTLTAWDGDQPEF